MSGLRAALSVRTGGFLLILAGFTAGCGMLDEVSDPEPGSDPAPFTTEYRANDKETRQLGFSNRARDIERSVGIR